MIISVGEIVWDIFGDKKVLGGAPLNVAYHLSKLGHDITLISRVGSDNLASDTLAKITDLGIPTHSIQQDDILPTGQVKVTLGNDNEPSFDIVAPAAWDAIDGSSLDWCKDKKYNLIFGSLAQRSAKSRATIRSLWNRAGTIFYDVNLRPPFTPTEVVVESLAAAHVVKLNDKELHTVADWLKVPPGNLQGRAQNLFSLYNWMALTVTLGESGAFVVSKDGLFEHPGFPVKVIDTVGAGDAFFAAFIDSVLNNRDWPACLDAANSRGAYVAGCQGATPSMDDFSPQNFNAK